MIGFPECGTLQSETTNDNTTLTTYIHHQVVTNGSVISLMGQIEVHCVLRLVRLFIFFKSIIFKTKVTQQSIQIYWPK